MYLFSGNKCVNVRFSPYPVPLLLCIKAWMYLQHGLLLITILQIQIYIITI